MAKKVNKPILAPILKWVGGKRQLLDKIKPFIPNDFSMYVEPFVGGGAVLFDLHPENAIINDFNSELINVYLVIKNSPNELIELLKVHDKKNSVEYFYEIRELDRDERRFAQLTNIEKAARIIFLNKTCYNGLYRVNSAGQFNTPYGKYKRPNIVNEAGILAMSEYLNNNNITILNGDYKEALNSLDENAFVYLDPPYMTISSSSSFTGYTEGGFDENKQIELKQVCDDLNKRGIKFLQSNSDCEFIRELYKDYQIHTVQAKRAINSKATSRGAINEVLICNYE